MGKLGDRFPGISTLSLFLFNVLLCSVSKISEFPHCVRHFGRGWSYNKIQERWRPRNQEHFRMTRVFHVEEMETETWSAWPCHRACPWQSEDEARASWTPATQPLQGLGLSCHHGAEPGLWPLSCEISRACCGARFLSLCLHEAPEAPASDESVLNQGDDGGFLDIPLSGSAFWYLT